jgi:hypothetical protein
MWHALIFFIFLATLFTGWRVYASGCVVLTWNPSPDAATVGYNIYYGVSSRDYTNKISLGNVTNAVITGLAAGSTYYFAATAYYATGYESPLSNQTVYTVPPPAVLSLSPTMINGSLSSLSIIANGTVPDQWAIQSSPDLINWTTIATGTNVTINLPLAVSSAPQQFFRLVSQ